MIPVYCTSRTNLWLAPIQGDCLEAIGIEFSNRTGYAIIAPCTQAHVGDLIICNEIAGSIFPKCKRVIEADDQHVIVGTAYRDNSRDFTFEPEEILGRVVEIYDRQLGGTGKLIYQAQDRKLINT